MRSIPRSLFGLAVVLVVSAWGASASAAGEWSVSSPADTLSLTVRLTDGGALEYRVQLAASDGPKTVVGWSALGVTRSWVDQAAASATVRVDLSKGLTFVSADESAVHDDHLVAQPTRSSEGQFEVGLVLVGGVFLDHDIVLVGPVEAFGTDRVEIAHEHRWGETEHAGMVEARVGADHVVGRLGQELLDGLPAL